MANFTVVNWPPLTELTSTRMQQMMDNDQHLKDLVDAGSYGVLGTPGKKTSSQGSITSEVALTSLSVSGTTLSSRNYKITLSIRSFSTTVAGDVFQLTVKQDGSLVIGEWNLYFPVAGTGINGGSYVTTLVPAAGAHTYQAYATRITGTGTGTLDASSTGPATLIVEDIGT